MAAGRRRMVYGCARHKLGNDYPPGGKSSSSAMKVNFVRSLTRRIETKVRRGLFSAARRQLFRDAGPTMQRFERYGSAYGGWHLPASFSLTSDDVVFSAGAGEDVSFDLALLSRFSPKLLVIVDPTPRAIAHFEALKSSLAQGAEWHEYPGGRYNLSGIAPGHLVYEAKALWNEDGTVTFWAPWNPRYVSHSILDFQHAAGSSTTVPSVRVSTLARTYGKVPKLVKLDIEGAETEVICDMLANQIHPEYLAVEYDELGFPARSSSKKILTCHKNLLQCGYRLLHFDGHNALYRLG